MKFQTDDHNNEQIGEWLQAHAESCKYWQPDNRGLLPQGASGGSVTYCFTPTTLGLVTHVQCACGEKQDVTDYDKW